MARYVPIDLCTPEMHGEEPQRDGNHPRSQAGCDARSEFSSGCATRYPAARLKVAPAYPDLSEHCAEDLRQRMKHPRRMPVGLVDEEADQHGYANQDADTDEEPEECAHYQPESI